MVSFGAEIKKPAAFNYPAIPYFKTTITTSFFMIRLILCLFILLMFSGIYADSVFAQQVQPDTEQSLLPDIDPQDIEIRSQFQARFPGLRRQPILGFNPNPRVFQSDPNRLPFIEDQEAVMASLPIGILDRAEPPVYRKMGYSDPKIAFIRGGIGSEISPEADLFAIAKLNDHNWLSGSVNYHSSNGHEERENVNTSFRLLNADINSYNRFSSRTHARFGAGVTSNFNHMPQLNTTVDDFLGVNTKVEQTGFHASTDLDIAKTPLTGIKVHAGGLFNEYSINSGLSELSGLSSEWGIRAGGSYSRLGNNINEVYRVKVFGKYGSVEPVSGESSLWSISTLSAHYERLFNFRTDVKGTLGFSGVSDAEDNFIFYFSPELEVKHTFFTGFNIRAIASGKPNHLSLVQVHNQNRFFDFSSALRHQYEMMALGEVQLEPVYGTKIIGGASFQDIKNYLYYSRVEAPAGIDDIDAGYFAAQFENANIFRVYGGFSQDLRPDIFWLSLDGSWQVPRLTDSDRNIPYVESLSLRGTVSIRPVRELLLEGWSEFVSGRQDHNNEKMSSHVLIGSRFEISLSDRYGVYGKILNILNEEYEFWQGYRERGFQGYVGFTVLF